jgi:REase_MTES_1575
VPQWPSRGKFIDLVVTDGDGRRLAIEADGEQHHEMQGGALIPEDIERQALLEEAGWVFHRIRHSDFKANPEGEIERLVAHLREQPADADLAARMRGEEVLSLLDALHSQPPTELFRGAGDASSAAALLAEHPAIDDAEVVIEPAIALPTRDSGGPVREDEIAHEPLRVDPPMSPQEMESLLDDVFAGVDEGGRPGAHLGNREPGHPSGDVTGDPVRDSFVEVSYSSRNRHRSPSCSRPLE